VADVAVSALAITGSGSSMQRGLQQALTNAYFLQAGPEPSFLLPPPYRLPQPRPTRVCPHVGKGLGPPLQPPGHIDPRTVSSECCGRGTRVVTAARVSRTSACARVSGPAALLMERAHGDNVWGRRWCQSATRPSGPGKATWISSQVLHPHLPPSTFPDTHTTGQETSH
jgi:hypothetical protein